MGKDSQLSCQRAWGGRESISLDNLKVTLCGVIDNNLHSLRLGGLHIMSMSHFSHNLVALDNTYGRGSEMQWTPTPSSHDVLWCLVNIYHNLHKKSHSHTHLISDSPPMLSLYILLWPNCQMPFYCPLCPRPGQVTSFLSGPSFANYYYYQGDYEWPVTRLSDMNHH